MTKRAYKHLFGPVPSRRLGRSLGVDLVPLKLCPFDCIYCQLGRTSLKTAQRKAYVPAEEVLRELADFIASGAERDYITLSGSGEPTLHSDLGRIIRSIKEMTDTPVAVLTNGALLWDVQVRGELAPADVVLPSLDAGDEETFQRINRPCSEVSFERLVEGLKAFRDEYAGRIHLEVFLVAGVNDSDEQVRKIRAVAGEIRPDRIDVNTVARPPAEPDARAVEPDKLERLREILGPTAQIIAPLPPVQGSDRANVQTVLAMLRRRPCTVADCARALNCHSAEAAKLLEQLSRQGAVVARSVSGQVYYQVRGQHRP